MPWFEIVESEDILGKGAVTIEVLKARRKWQTRYLSIPTREYILRTLNHYLKPREKANLKLFAFITYLTSGRRNEVRGIRKSDITKHKVTYGNDSYDVMLFDLMNEKNKFLPRKQIPVVKGVNPPIDDMLNYIESYLEAMPPEEDLLFNVEQHSSTKNQQLSSVLFEAVYRDTVMPISESLKIRFKLFPHFLRHARLTHLSFLGILPLVQLAGWSKGSLRQFAAAELLETYIRSDWQATARLMIQSNTA